MKKILAALILTAAIATPAMAQTYVQSNGMSTAPVVQAQPYMGYGAYTYAPGWDSSEVNNAAFAIDPDPSVRTQLQIQSDLTDR
jgi:opacity protein-like surface antigen